MAWSKRLNRQRGGVYLGYVVVKLLQGFFTVDESVARAFPELHQKGFLGGQQLAARVDMSALWGASEREGSLINETYNIQDEYLREVKTGTHAIALQSSSTYSKRIEKENG